MAFQMKGGLYTLTTLELHAADIALIRAQLQNMTRKAPNFFQQTPVVIDFGKLDPEQKRVDLSALRRMLHEFGMIFIAIQGGTNLDKKEATINGIAWLPANKTKPEDPAKPKKPENTQKVVMIKQCDNPVEQNNEIPEQPKQVDIGTRIIDRPVRSGQQVYAPGDLVVLGPVSTGSELLAGGHIHVYGPLRGRALAGVNGNKDARIFCRNFEAELISICGQYKLPAHSDQSYWSQSVLISLNDQCLHMAKL
ncbi:septum site-determining protein MinC [Endozoicomonas sp. Mp262]|uniref:septum site-determining protein MinC n=1 Tax=Endozoicomonas sp. Mp262 TaxID=2919499 RepID=UPI0021DAF538